MSVVFQNNCEIIGFGKDYFRIRDFLASLKDPSFSFARWDWMMKHGELDASIISKIGIWEDNNEIVGVALFDTDLGNGHFCVRDEYAYLKEEMLLYAAENYKNGTYFEAFITDTDLDFQRIAYKNGYISTSNKEADAYFPIDERSLHYELPDGFRISSMAGDYDVFKYGEALFKGFDHEKEDGKFFASEQDIENYHREFRAPNVNKRLKIVILDAKDEFAAYCGMWYDNDAKRAIVEPLVTIPKYRKMGLAKAAVYEGIMRCKELGAKDVFVGSSQQFYYAIGFMPCANGSYWIKNHS